jgi:hypothetical protein
VGFLIIDSSAFADKRGTIFTPYPSSINRLTESKGRRLSYRKFRTPKKAAEHYRVIEAPLIDNLAVFSNSDIISGRNIIDGFSGDAGDDNRV